MDADVIVVGAGLAGLVADGGARGRRASASSCVDQEPEASLGGQAFWSLGGLFLVDTPEQRRLRDPRLPRARLAGLARARAGLRPRRGSTGRGAGPRRTSTSRRREARLAARDRASVLPDRRLGRARRRDLATGHGNSVPRFHLTWGTGPGVVEPFVRRVREAVARGLVTLRFRHRVDELIVDGRRGDRRPRRGARAERGRPRRGELARRRGRVRALGPGRDRHVRRHRRQSRPRPRELAVAARRPADAHGLPACPRTSTGGCSRSRRPPAAA